LTKWAQSLGAPENEPLDVNERLEMVERLAMLGEPWCLDALRSAAHEERDPKVSDAIAAALRTI
jgi:hypothetical protein